MIKAWFLRPAAALAFAIAIHAAPAAAQGTAPIDGTWLTEAQSQITIAECPDGFCGTISKIVVPPDVYKANKKAIDSMDMSKVTDLQNKDPSLRTRPILGLQILTLHAGDKPKIFDGQIYNPQDGGTYSGYIEVLGPNKIKLNGCVLYNIVCKGEEWVRVPDVSDGAPLAPSGKGRSGSGKTTAPATAAGSFQ